MVKVLKAKNLNRSEIIRLRLTQKEYEQIEKKWKASTCLKLSSYVRAAFLKAHCNYLTEPVFE